MSAHFIKQRQAPAPGEFSFIHTVTMWFVHGHKINDA